ncbi:MFS transporter [Streptomyces nymphaeiformis]|uniref:Putative MFS family arabinose efflux permease n=1 Tax=Streptomyces nymphaeiformis TaxID=2663842 RepID=A0A7W7XA82_9ACTN|nr:MFS transporter [Streptomyces nymphaeiformis]MBB4979848.1 putative MFS family arabinose efflux permease [Streptomyces nymphaeiformis]
MTATTPAPTLAAPRPPWPLGGLLTLSGAAFVTILTEALPAGVLPAMSSGLGVTEARAGLLVTVYALAAAVTAIPMTAWTLRLPRRTLLLSLLLGFAATNAVTAASTGFALTLGARILSGVFAGMLWAMVPAYAARLAPHRGGKAIATALAGMTVGLSLGVPAGTALGGLIGWRGVFAALTGLALALAATARWRLPALAGQKAGEVREGRGLRATIRTPGIAAINAASIAMVLGFYVLYTYIAPFVERAGLAVSTGTVLFVFGLGSTAGVWIAGATADRWLRRSTLTLLALSALCLVTLGLFAGSTAVVLVAAVLWGVTHGGIPALMQTAGVRAAPHDPDTANSLWVTGWNVAMAGGSLLGGAVLAGAGTSALPWTAAALLAVSVLTAGAARRHGFPL